VPPVRQSDYLIQRYRVILSHTGIILALAALIMLFPLLSLVGRPVHAGELLGFLAPAILLLVIGVLLWRLLRKPGTVLTLQEGGVIVLLSWIIVCLFSAWPFMAVQGLNFTQAVFESVSGWTTTGLSVVDVTSASPGILLWRSIMQLFGGAGLAIIMLAAITGPTGPALSTAEGREQLVPHVRESAKLVMIIYTGYAILGVVGLRLAGMGWFDAANHSFAAVSTGGFSTSPDSIGHWGSVAVEAVVLPLMILGNLSFVTAWLLLRGRFRDTARNGEVRVMAVLIPVCAAALFLLTCRELYPSFSKSVRVAVFETVTALTTTGFSTTTYADWKGFGILAVIVLMLVGGGTCSTAGGIKQYRIHLLWKSLCWELRRPFLPRTAVVENAVWENQGEVFISDARLRQIGTFLFLYLLTLAVGTAVLVAHGYNLKESLFEFASAQGTVGLSLGVTGPKAPPGVLWAEITGMFLGRLEFLVIFLSIAKVFRDLKAMANTA